MELVALVGGELNAAFRMVLGSWDMPASLVTSGAIDGEAFRAAHGEILATFSKIHFFLGEIRSASGDPDFCRHMEAVVRADRMPKPCWPAGGTRRSPWRKSAGSRRCRPVRDHRSMARDTGRLRQRPATEVGAGI